MGALHAVVSALAPLALADVIRFEPSPRGFEVACDLGDLPAKDNVAWRAAQALNIPLPALRIVIDKHIPTQAGLGGGSADAAATLQGIVALLAADGVTVEPQRIAAAALHAGSDVPSFFASGTRIISGVGDVVIARPCRPPAWGIVLLLPAVASSTAQAYALLDRAGIPHELGARSMAIAHEICDAFCSGEFERTIHLLHNDFTVTIESALPAIVSARERLRNAGAAATILCGSGSCVAGFFKDISLAQGALSRITVHDGEWITATTFAGG